MRKGYGKRNKLKRLSREKLAAKIVEAQTPGTELYKQSQIAMGILHFVKAFNIKDVKYKSDTIVIIGEAVPKDKEK